MSLPITIQLGRQEAQSYVGWRCLHVAEGGYQTPAKMPEVRPSVYARPIDFTEPLQRLAMALNAWNPLYTGTKFRSTYNGGIAFTNNQGFDDPDAGPRRDYINGRDLTAEYPRLMKAIICGGMFIRGAVDGNYLVCYPGVHGIDANKPIPSADEVKERNWYFHAVTWDGTRVWNFPQGSGNPVLIPYVLRDPAPYPLSWFVRWNADALPDHLKIYG